MNESVQKVTGTNGSESITGLGPSSSEPSEIIKGLGEYSHPSSDEQVPPEVVDSKDTPSQEDVTNYNIETKSITNDETETIVPDVPVEGSPLTEFGGSVEADANEKYREQIKQIV